MKDSGKTFLITAIAFFAIIGAVLVFSSFKSPELEFRKNPSSPSSLTLVTSRDGISIYRIGDCYVAKTDQGISITR